MEKSKIKYHNKKEDSRNFNHTNRTEKDQGGCNQNVKNSLTEGQNTVKSLKKIGENMHWDYVNYQYNSEYKDENPQEIENRDEEKQGKEKGSQCKSESKQRKIQKEPLRSTDEDTRVFKNNNKDIDLRQSSPSELVLDKYNIAQALEFSSKINNKSNSNSNPCSPPTVSVLKYEKLNKDFMSSLEQMSSFLMATEKPEYDTTLNNKSSKLELNNSNFKPSEMLKTNLSVLISLKEQNENLKNTNTSLTNENKLLKDKVEALLFQLNNGVNSSNVNNNLKSLDKPDFIYHNKEEFENLVSQNEGNNNNNLINPSSNVILSNHSNNQTKTIENMTKYMDSIIYLQGKVEKLETENAKLKKLIKKNNKQSIHSGSTLAYTGGEHISLSNNNQVNHRNSTNEKFKETNKSNSNNTDGNNLTSGPNNNQQQINNLTVNTSGRRIETLLKQQMNCMQEILDLIQTKSTPDVSPKLNVIYTYMIYFIKNCYICISLYFNNDIYICNIR